MKTYSHKIGAIFYALWGLLHIIGAGVLLLQLARGGATSVLALIGSATPVTELPQVADGLTGAVLAYYAWNLLWIGGFVLVVAIKLNWQNSPMGYWLNLAVVSAVDLGLIGTLVAPGHMAFTDGLMGVALWLPAVVFSTLGLLTAARQPVDRLVTA